ncbi:MAG: response regulator transcription factor [Syntrophorhabdales bacterium]|jgi:DNA-binding response OmpR family regulator
MEHETGSIMPARTPLLAVVDDDEDIMELVSVHLKKAGMKVRTFGDAGSFYRFIQRETPDLVLLDLMLPDADGLEICKSMRKGGRFQSVPVIMLTARADEVDKVLGLEMGADDYITKPFSPKELVARVKAVLRRSEPRVPESHEVEIGGLLTIDLRRHLVVIENKTIEVTPVEFRILEFLGSKPGWVFSRERILDFLWGHDKVVSERTVDVHIRHLREKMGKASRFIRNVRGAGYKLEA